jgi:phosphate transport system substrate-binding protein
MPSRARRTASSYHILGYLGQRDEPYAHREPLDLSPTTQRIEDSGELSDKISKDPYGIGFIGLPYIRASKGLLIYAVNHPYFPTLYTIRTETYPLSRRLYMYAPRASANPEIARFLQFVGSTAGQKVVGKLDLFRLT